MNEPDRLTHCDVAVVGAGTAAFEAAVAARLAGAEHVMMLEKAPERAFGGNGRFSHTGFRWVYSGAQEVREFLPDIDDAAFAKMHLPGYTGDQFRADLDRMTQGRIQKDLADVLVDGSNAAMHWMLDLGIKWEPERGTVVADRRYFEPGGVIHPVGGVRGGLNQLLQWREIALQLGVDIRYNSPVYGIVGDPRAVRGVLVSGPDGSYNLTAGAVILCSGGFQASSSERAKYLGANADLMKVRGSRYDTGEVLRCALDLGAKPAGHWQGAHATPVDATFPDVEQSNRANRYSYRFGITVNSLGQRFFDEGESFVAYTYAKIGWLVQSQPGAVAYQIFDAKGARLLNDSYREYAQCYEADSVEQLAVGLGVEPALLQHTVDTFNASVTDGVDFDASRLDGRGTEGIVPPKSNWAQRIDEPPYRSFAVTGGVTFTFGGLQVDTAARVINTLDEPIAGLYASGDILGLFYHNYPGFTGQTRNVVFGKLAGGGAAKDAGRTWAP